MTTTPVSSAESTGDQRLSVGDGNPNSHSSNKGRKKPLQFLDLPSDIHRLVLGHLLLKEARIRLKPYLYGIKPVNGLSAAILQVNRYLHHEGCSVLYGLNVFEIEASVSLGVPNELFSYIKRIFKLLYKVFSRSWLWLISDKLEPSSSSARRWLDEQGGYSIRELRPHLVGLHSLEIDVSLPFPSPTRSPSIVKELRNLPLPVLHRSGSSALMMRI